MNNYVDKSYYRNFRTLIAYQKALSLLKKINNLGIRAYEKSKIEGNCIKLIKYTAIGNSQVLSEMSALYYYKKARFHTYRLEGELSRTGLGNSEDFRKINSLLIEIRKMLNYYISKIN